MFTSLYIFSVFGYLVINLWRMSAIAGTISWARLIVCRKWCSKLFIVYGLLRIDAYVFSIIRRIKKNERNDLNWVIFFLVSFRQFLFPHPNYLLLPIYTEKYTLYTVHIYKYIYTLVQFIYILIKEIRILFFLK